MVLRLSPLASSGLPSSAGGLSLFQSAAEHMARELEFEDIYADLPESCCQKLTDLEELLSQETGDKIALVAYRL